MPSYEQITSLGSFSAPTLATALAPALGPGGWRRGCPGLEDSIYLSGGMDFCGGPDVPEKNGAGGTYVLFDT